MSEHYFTNQPQTESKPLLFKAKLREQALTFHSDQGVFAKSGVDLASSLLVETVEVKKNARILDVGCGYGTIGITLAKESAVRDVWMIDVNERAIQLAKQNARENKVTNVNILTSDLFSALLDERFDIIITNPPIRAGKKVIYQLFEESVHHLLPGGELWLVMHKKHGAASAIIKLEELFSDVLEVTKKKGFRIIRAKNED